MSGKLQALFEYLDGLQEQPSLAELTAMLAKLDISAADLKDHIHFSDQGYTHNTVRAGRWYHAWVLCWKNGQRSPIHDHKGSSCGVRVLRGTLTQTLFEFAGNGHVKAVGSFDSEPGSVIGSHDMDLHQVSNLQPGDADLVTLHVYSPPLVRMGTYSLTDLSRGEEVWEVEEPKVIQAFPENLETPLQTVHGWVTPNRLFFVRNHFDMPVIDRATWRLRIEGQVKRPLELTWEELTELPERSLFATVECAGNGRSFLQKRVPGVQWGAGAIGHAEWTGVPLHLVLERAGIEPGALEVLFEGADQGSEPDHPESMHFARSLPLDKARHPDTILAYRMNGELLTPSHGSPLRLFVPGWYGVASVKWLQRIEVSDRPFQGYYQTVKYTVQRRRGWKLETEPVHGMAVKSEILRPAVDTVLPIGTNRVFGIAWAGEERVARVDFSTDGGQSWNPAQLIGRSLPYCWTLWEYLWEAASAGSYTLLARTTSAGGRVQAREHDPLNGGYVIDHSRPTAVRVEAVRPHDAELLLYDMNAFAEANASIPLDVELEFGAGEGI
jgi:DMSO/TMAO reductase YedYZ molybdopterin-dependent catalytic subunit/predicted metal-dependent enzyme (double-stranded beta helix superfamily)